jgi:hypothetical protein
MGHLAAWEAEARTRLMPANVAQGRDLAFPVRGVPGGWREGRYVG